MHRGVRAKPFCQGVLIPDVARPRSSRICSAYPMVECSLSMTLQPVESTWKRPRSNFRFLVITFSPLPGLVDSTKFRGTG